jgi:hypothetical protein
MRSSPGGSAAWATLLPGDTIWLSSHGQLRTRRLRRTLAADPQSRCRAVIEAPWSFGRTRRPDDAVESVALQAYVAFPSCERPILVASRDAAVLRYVADSVLSVPPGAGLVPSMVLTAGLRLLRLPTMWNFAAIVRAAGVILVGRAR